MALDTSAENPAPVRTIANALSGWIDRLGSVWVEGQLTQVTRRPTLATVYMTLRDADAEISIEATCPRHVYDALPSPPQEGASVVLHAKPSYFLKRGSLSLYAREIRLVGLGELLARLEQRRAALATEGLFSPVHKKALPFLPGTVGLVTAANSAAERDVLENARRRWPAVKFSVVHAKMQGPLCAAEVAAAAQRLDADPDVEVIVIARGGGSVEDLLPFSEESLVRAVHALETPVVSAIGHEPDQPILDLVADVRASTPTAAAALVVPDFAEESAGLTSARDRLRYLVAAFITREQQQLDALRSRPAMADPRTMLDARADEVQALRERARRHLEHRLDRASDDIDHHRARARALSPLATLKRGYAVVQDAQGHVLTSIADAPAGTDLQVRLADGRLSAQSTGGAPLDHSASPSHSAPPDHSTHTDHTGESDGSEEDRTDA